ncbi:MAG: HIRAN domain-containing protein [Allosphingosinicella sp.]
MKLRYFSRGLEFEQHNDGRSYSEVEKLGFRGYPAFSVQQEVHADGVEAALMRRLPPRSRSDFVEYTKLFRLPPGLTLSNMGLLARSEAKLPSDGFSVVDPLRPDAVACDLVLEVAGFRFYREQLEKSLQLGDQVSFAAEDDNLHDSNAVAIRAGGTVIGYVNRLQASTFRAWLKERDLTAWVDRLNGDPERPRVFVFVEVRPQHLRQVA